MPTPKTLKVLFLCTGNSARSILGEFLLRHLGGARVEVTSAGARPTGKVHPLAVAVLADRFGIDASAARSKSVSDLGDARFDLVITVCDDARDSCPLWPHTTALAHWGMQDPAAADGDEVERRRVFELTADRLLARIKELLSLPIEELSRPQLAARANQLWSGSSRRRRQMVCVVASCGLAFTMACGPDARGPAPAPPSIPQIVDQGIVANPGLLAGLANGDEATRVRAARAMGRIQDASYAEPLARAAASGNPTEVRAAALFALGQLGLAEGARPLGAALVAAGNTLSDPDPELAALAVEALGKQANADSLPLLTAQLGHREPLVREKAAHALFRSRFVPVWRRETKEPPPLPPESVAALVHALGDAAAEVRRAAAHAFSRYAQPEAIAGLGQAFDDTDEWVRIFAARALGRTGDPAAVAPLLPFVADPSPRVRAAAVTALAALGAGDRVGADAARDASLHVRAAAATGWGGGSDPAAVATLERLALDGSPTVRAAALEALARRQGEASLPLLERAFGAGPWPLQVAVTRAAGGLGLAGRPLLDRALAHPDARVRSGAVDGLGRLPAEDLTVTEAIAAQLGTADLGVRGAAVTALVERLHGEKLRWLTETYDASPGVDWVEVREEIVRATANVEGAEELLLRIAAEDESPSVRSRARASLAEKGLGGPAEPMPAGEPELSPLLGVAFDAAPTVVLETSKGTIKILTFPEEAPIHVANFVELVKKGFYDGLIWHRMVSNFVIQGGDPLGNGWGGPGYALRDEVNRLPFRQGAVGMPKAGKDTGGCQLFITHVPTPHLEGNYTIFGQVIDGFDVVDQIEVGDLILRATLHP